MGSEQEILNVKLAVGKGRLERSSTLYILQTSPVRSARLATAGL